MVDQLHSDKLSQLCNTLIQTVNNVWDMLQALQEFKALRWWMSSLCGQMNIMCCTLVEVVLCIMYNTPQISNSRLLLFLILPSCTLFKSDVGDQLFEVSLSWGWDAHASKCVFVACTLKDTGQSLHWKAHLLTQRIPPMSPPPTSAHLSSGLSRTGCPDYTLTHKQTHADREDCTGHVDL